MSCITMRDFWESRIWNLIPCWPINCRILWKKNIVFVLYLDFFCKYPRGSKEYKGDALHFCNRFFMCLISKFDELKEFHLLKKLLNFAQCLEFFLKCIMDLRESKTEFIQKDSLSCCNTLLLGSRLNFDKILTY